MGASKKASQEVTLELSLEAWRGGGGGVPGGGTSTRRGPEVRGGSTPVRAKGTSGSPFLLPLPELRARHVGHIGDCYRDLSE